MKTFSMSTDEKLIKLNEALNASQSVHVNGRKYTQIANADAQDLVRIGYILVSTNENATFAMLTNKGEERLAELAEQGQEQEQEQEQEQDFAFEGGSLFGEDFPESEALEVDTANASEPPSAPTSSESSIMAYIKEKGGATANAVAKKLGSEVEGIKVVLDSLVEKGALDKQAKTYRLAQDANLATAAKLATAEPTKNHKETKGKELIIENFLNSVRDLLNELI